MATDTHHFSRVKQACLIQVRNAASSGGVAGYQFILRTDYLTFGIAFPQRTSIVFISIAFQFAIMIQFIHI